MSDSALVIGTIYAVSQATQGSNVAANTTPTIYAAMTTQGSDVAVNNTQEIVFEPKSSAKEYMIASEKSLMRIWMTYDEDEAWKDL